MNDRKMNRSPSISSVSSSNVLLNSDHLTARIDVSLVTSLQNDIPLKNRVSSKLNVNEKRFYRPKKKSRKKDSTEFGVGCSDYSTVLKASKKANDKLKETGTQTLNNQPFLRKILDIKDYYKQLDDEKRKEEEAEAKLEEEEKQKEQELNEKDRQLKDIIEELARHDKEVCKIELIHRLLGLKNNEETLNLKIECLCKTCFYKIDEMPSKMDNKWTQTKIKTNKVNPISHSI